ncbi:Mu transposase C-terminal domain-containing protein [Tropicibacter oceani]|uniref:Integrase catalytic domain-containing protein n=1 Tax=Tropicibacter oceani TaxID=3058420 RepID=A0ABY8QMU1_9RHOB|nr:Mu transposase C-terminal domain-containing protein [Tropicibacter oceani]WGW05097.1 hypothetical protein QF118_05990 [Tropicibacter oceani]
MLDFLPSNITPKYALEIGDEVILDRNSWVVRDVREDRFIFVQKFGSQLAQEFTSANLALHIAKGTMQHIPCRPVHMSSRTTDLAIAEFLASRTAEEHKSAERREALVLAMQQLHREKKLKYTDESIAAAKNEIRALATDFYGRVIDGDTLTPEWHSPRTLRRWLKAYDIGGLTALYDDRRARGFRAPRFTAEVNALLQPIIIGYMSPTQPTKATVWENVKSAFRLENARREAAGEPLLDMPSRETVRQRIDALDPFEVMVHRNGIQAARRAFAPVGQGLDIYRPLQRVEIDELRIDLMTYLKTSGLLNHMTIEEIKALGLHGKKAVRVLVTVAVDVATRCIVGMKMSLEGSSDSALQCVEMIHEDKGIYADAIGAFSPWHMHGKPGVIVTDCAKYNISGRTKQAIAALAGNLEHCPAGEPAMKGTIERIFQILATKLLPRFSGRTFSDVVQKAGNDPQETAALTIEELCAVLVRWVVDIYHRTPHRGLGGETPLDAWNRMVAQYGVTPSADKSARRIAFGKEETRDPQRNGLTVMQIPYHDERLAAYFMHKKKRALRLRWHPNDLGTISVELDGDWVDVKAVPAWAQGLKAAIWEKTLRELSARRRRGEEVSGLIVARAIAEITALHADAMRREGILVETWTEERLRRVEETAIGFADFGDTEAKPANEGDMLAGGYGISLSTAGAHTKADLDVVEHSAEPPLDISETMSAETTPDSFSVPEPSNAHPLRRRSRRSAAEKSGDADDGFTFED